VLVELVEDDLLFGPTLQLYHDAHAIAIGLVAYVGDVVNDFVVDQLRDPLDQNALVHLVGDFRDDDGFAALSEILHPGLGAHHEAPAAVCVSAFNSAAPIDVGAGREVRALYDFQNFFERGGRIVHQHDRCIHDLGEVVRRDVGGHSHGDPARSIDQQIGNARREHTGLDRGFVIVGDEVDSLFVDVFHQRAGDAHEAAFGVTHGRRWVAIDGTEVTLSIDQRIAQREI